MGSDRSWKEEVEKFEKSKAGVKGLVDSGITKLPCLFRTPFRVSETNDGSKVQIPVIDLQGVDLGGSRRSEIVKEIRRASENWGIFQIVNHGIPDAVMDGILESTRRFHEQPKEAKMDLYSSDNRCVVRFHTINGRLERSHPAGWRDSLSCIFSDGVVDPEVIPRVCRDGITEYMKHMKNIGEALSGLFSEALGLRQNTLSQMQYMNSQYITCLYYPPCPEPDRALGARKHTDPVTLAILVNDITAGLQIHYDGRWVDVPPIPGALTVNVGDFMQVITNDKFKSVEHRVLASEADTRLSTVCFFYPNSEQIASGEHGPIDELVSDSDPPLYRAVNYVEFSVHYHKMAGRGHSFLSDFRL
ncbi:1-aminocyclopropane-1-carboxylate oxidase homolog 11-like [Andrographis paniculata]|uniref:1-aminocyclopropane-1-carboxylate oxidase homolog 11-like n=1 Tax=Andrographis paniculata TaxID=175694 RepID=UPI0021E8A4BE|nr:1-aminocyclopropane-1-carboxylate oxidase homolog 11-like [Andrographis paniculata]